MRSTILVTSLALAAGCSGPAEVTSSVSGTVTLNGQPVPFGTVSFEPEGGGRPVAVSIKDGKFAAEKVPVGKKKVVATGFKDVSGTSGEPMFPPDAAGNNQPFEVKPGAAQTLTVAITSPAAR